MSLKRKPAEKRAKIPLTSDYTKQFQKDWDRLSGTARYDMSRLKEVMLLIIANDAPLPAEWRDHELKGEWKGKRECHVGGDFLLIYDVDDTSVIFVRIGTHAELFK